MLLMSSEPSLACFTATELPCNVITSTAPNAPSPRCPVTDDDDDDDGGASSANVLPLGYFNVRAGMMNRGSNANDDDDDDDDDVVVVGNGGGDTTCNHHVTLRVL